MADDESETPLQHNLFDSGSDNSDNTEEEEDHENSFDFFNGNLPKSHHF